MTLIFHERNVVYYSDLILVQGSPAIMSFNCFFILACENWWISFMIIGLKCLLSLRNFFYFLSICFQLLIFGSFNSKVQALITKLAYLWIFLFPLSLCHYHSLLVTFCNYEHYPPLQKSNHIPGIDTMCCWQIMMFSFSLFHVSFLF